MNKGKRLTIDGDDADERHESTTEVITDDDGIRVP